MKSILILILVTFSSLVGAATNLPAETNIAVITSKQTETSLSLRDYLEMLSFAATITTALVAIFALKQIRLARLQFGVASATLKVAQDDIKIRSRREAVSLAAKHCEDFGDIILPKLNGWRNEIAAKGLAIRPIGAD